MYIYIIFCNVHCIPPKNQSVLKGLWATRCLISCFNKNFVILLAHQSSDNHPGPAEPDMPCLCKQCRSRSVGFLEANLSGSTLFVFQYVNLYQLSRSSYLIGWQLEEGLASLFSMARVKNRYQNIQSLLEHLTPYHTCSKIRTSSFHSLLIYGEKKLLDKWQTV